MNEFGLAYESEAGSVSLVCGTELHIDTTPLHSWGYSYSLSYRGVYGVTSKAREVKVQTAFHSRESCDRARRLFLHDLKAGTPGEISCGEWRATAYIASCETKDQRHPITAELVIVLCDGVWRRRHELYVPLPSTEPERGDLDYPYDYPYDLAKPVPSRRVQASEWGESAVGFVIYGPAAEPAIEIGGNTYQVLRDVGIGERVEVDGISRTVELVTAGGERVNVAGDAVRGRGYGGGSYIFQPLPPGGSEVIADGSFAFDVIWYDEEGEPPWSPS